MPLKMRRRASALIMALALVFLSPLAPRAAAQAAAKPARVDTYDPKRPQSLNDDDLTARAALVMDARTGDVLYDKNARRKTYPASTTKIMTCLLALEHGTMEEIVTIPPESAQVPGDSSNTGVKPGEQMTMGDLLSGMMIRSGNDAAVAVAVHVAGSVPAFVDMMNERARQLGMKDTHFVNAHGYHDEAHVSTAYDLALLAREAMLSRDFRDIVAAKSYTMAPTALREKVTFATKNPMFVASSKFYYPDLVGIKTGYHSKAGQCFVGAAVKDGVELISVVLKCGGGKEPDNKWTDTARLMDYAITRYETLTFEQLLERAPVYASVKDAALNDPDAGVLKLSVVPGTALDGYKLKCLPEREAESLKAFSEGLKVSYTDELTAPIRMGDILGTLTMPMNGQNVEAKLVASRDVAREAEPFSMERLFPGLRETLTSPAVLIGAIVLVLLLIAVIVAKLRAAARERRRRRDMLKRRRKAYDRYGGSNR
ncbi:D-alanyl-D-alanine carboxypeptidase family protein [Bacillota bacterium Meth-B3]